MPGSGRTTVAKALCQAKSFRYIPATSWVKNSFREQNTGELPQQYLDEYHTWYNNRLKVDPEIIIDNTLDVMDAYAMDSQDDVNYVIDGLTSPRDLAHLFDYNNDIIVFLNRTNNDSEFKDYENIGVSVMRDYCFWLSSANLLPKERWFEYNYQIPGEDSDFMKSLGSKNSVFIVKSINKVISHLTNHIDGS